VFVKLLLEHLFHLFHPGFQLGVVVQLGPAFLLLPLLLKITFGPDFEADVLLFILPDPRPDVSPGVTAGPVAG